MNTIRINPFVLVGGEKKVVIKIGPMVKIEIHRRDKN